MKYDYESNLDWNKIIHNMDKLDESIDEAEKTLNYIKMNKMNFKIAETHKEKEDDFNSDDLNDFMTKAMAHIGALRALLRDSNLSEEKRQELEEELFRLSHSIEL